MVSLPILLSIASLSINLTEPSSDTLLVPAFPRLAIFFLMLRVHSTWIAYLPIFAIRGSLVAVKPIGAWHRDLSVGEEV